MPRSILPFRYLLLFCTFLPLTLAGQERLSLEQCLQQAFRNSNILRIAELGAESAEEKLAQSRSARLPSLTARSSYLHIGKISSFSIPMAGKVMDFQFGAPNRLSMELGMGMPLFTWGRLSRQIEMAKIGTEIGAIDRRQKALEVTDQVLRAWYTALLSQKAIATSALQVERADKNLAIARSRLLSGHASALEVLRAQVQAANAHTLLDENRLNLEKSNIWLARVIGYKDKAVTAAGETAYLPLKINADSIVSKTLARRLDLLNLGLQQEIVKKQIEIVGSTLRPTISGVAGWSLQNGFNPLTPDELVDNWNAGVQLTFPLFDGGITRHRMREGEKQLASVQLQEIEIREMAAVQIRQAMLSLEQSEQKYLSQMENIGLAREALASAEEQYQRGLLSSLDLIAAEQALAESELMALRALFSHILAKLDLCKVSGDYTLIGGNVQAGGF